ncbi:MAG: bifunctional homocysteine S-methyltransferase/methylenetetrahydrofolate reductase [Armatimonadetes bacterium CG_4_10_14_3_um_filter_66_18]|nr:bifunctional homocysteine S-methyltransferase/methylenetetrahydrofolate reductase [Armatimonadota bacterium]PIU90823.1 MAG: bifunctional homocysteine S-methyltransferase/methylenetetrahydrofolate reductase [Armatimonadetes bacterium CG06_land_8_20_14_3_00_66_21]PIX50149.1 MAG: bifunctional homocysteine S-methyltransferase/methylenetetrahydrofolate reductase [Armatimonadetes bacterium CG_4_8_14_3_um_filter_66_20]PIY45259.1 MAG: bifunctional homocysteine S-methyltransferase/methylenetetrahydrof
MQNLIERMKQSPVVFDGAMGTMIYDRGVFVNACYDELCLSKPDLIAEIHRDYVAAGVDVLETNTFGANRFKLRPHGLGEKVEQLNRAAVRLARQAGGDGVYVVGSVGPCTGSDQALPAVQAEAVREAFAEQIGALVGEGADAVLLETFAETEELRLALDAAAGCDCLVIASFTVNQFGQTAMGTEADVIVAELERDDRVDAIGTNCGTGPAGAFDTLERILPLTSKPVIVMSNAGLPKEVNGRMLYLTSPEYFTKYARKFIELGVRGVGGCCGTTPEHIRQMAKAIRALTGVKQHVIVTPTVRAATQVQVIPAAEKSRFARKLLSGEKGTSIELLPPRSIDMSSLIAKARQCAEGGADCVNIPDGPRASTRISPMIAALTIEREAGIEPILHYCCRDRNLIGMQGDLLGGYAAGLRNFLLITGDPPKLGDYPDATGVFDVDAIGLAQAVANLNSGVDIGGNPVDPPTGIFLGVAANPSAVDLEREVERYFRKLDAGAEFAITQPIFDTQALYRFLDRVEGYGRSIPVVAGVWPLTSFRNAEFMNNEVPGVVVTEDILERMAKCETKEEGAQAGVEIARETMDEIAGRVAGYQVSAPFGRVELALAALGLA